MPYHGHMKIWLPPYISVRRTDRGIRLGILPPHAIDIFGASFQVEKIICSLAVPQDDYKIVKQFVRQAGLKEAEAQGLVAQLIDLRILRPPFPLQDRYARHRLYYDLVGFEPGSQERLKNCAVGLIGLGGIGTHLALHLAAAGVKRLVMSDGDRVEISNLTRQTMFSESDVGKLKVEAAAGYLRKLRSDIELEIIPSRFSGPGLSDRVASRVDLIVLSADRPAAVHNWVNQSCIAAGIPHTNAGYIEGHGVVGPVFVPKLTPCYACIEVSSGQLSGEKEVRRNRLSSKQAEKNRMFQVASYGPLNALVASISANEVIRTLMKVQVATMGRRMLIDSRTYDVTWEDFKLAKSCKVCGRKMEMSTWNQISQQYERERKNHSFNSVLLDPILDRLLGDVKGKRIADVGAGSGDVTDMLLERGARVDAFEPMAPMADLLSRRLARWKKSGRLTILKSGLGGLSRRRSTYDIVVCLNVLDHMKDLGKAMKLLAKCAKSRGTLLLSVPHPIKDFGGWKKIPRADRWDYEHFIVDNYFAERRCEKVREDRNGNIRTRGVKSYHRTISTYLHHILANSLRVINIEEPKPSASIARTDQVLFEKSSRIPYFLVIVASKQ